MSVPPLAASSKASGVSAAIFIVTIGLILLVIGVLSLKRTVGLTVISVSNSVVW